MQRLLGCGPGLGARRLSFLYFSSIVSAALAQIVCAAVGLQPAGPVIGASGGLFGLLLAYAVLFPNRRVVPLFPPIPMPAWLFATVYGGVEFVFGVSGIESGVAHFAHLGGHGGERAAALGVAACRAARIIELRCIHRTATPKHRLAMSGLAAISAGWREQSPATRLVAKEEDHERGC